MRWSELNALGTALEGVPVFAVLPGGPAERAGVRYGDVILEVDGRRVKNIDEYLQAIAADPQDMRLRVFRQGAEVELVVHRARLPAPDAEPEPFARA